jgi:hypothetical protein
MPDNRTHNAPTTSSKDLFMRQTPAIHRLTGIRPSRLLRLAGTLASLSVAALGLSAAPALAEGCPNAVLRAENNSTRLPECRAYEMVTPLYKEGFPVVSVLSRSFTDDGVVSYSSVGSFAGNQQPIAGNRYHATRSQTGWVTSSVAPDRLFNVGGAGAGVEGESADLRRTLWRVNFRRDVPGDTPNFYLRGSDGAMTRIGSAEQPTGGTLLFAGGSFDLSHVLFNFGATPVYEHVGTGNEGPPHAASVDNHGQVQGPVCPWSISADGRVIVYSTECGFGTPLGVSQVWARVAGSASVWVSGSECTRTSGDPGGACNAVAPAEYAGAATDGSRVFFTTAQQLVNGDIDQTNDLYECEIPPGAPAPVGTANPCASLSEVSGNASGANVQSVVKVSDDGSRVYFVAQGVLASNLGSNDAAAVAGDNNLYVWEEDAAHPAGQTTFVAKLESGIGFHPQTTTDGRYLVFETASRLLASDTDEAPDVYRYDAQTGVLLRLSTDTNGSSGNEPGVEARLARAALYRPHSSVTDDGSIVVFESSEALSPADTDGVTDAYEWHDGQVSLISNGGGEEPRITSSGQDIFFFTTQPLTAGDSGLELDIYDARVGGGFPVSASAPCSGEACQGSMALQPQPPGVSASAAFSGPGSPPAAEAPLASPKSKPTPLTRAQKLAKALKACKSKHNKKKRTACEKKARNTYRRGK